MSSPPKNQSTKQQQQPPNNNTKQHHRRSSYLEQYNSIRGNALPLSKAANHDDFLHYFRCANPKYNPNNPQVAKVGLWSLLSYSTPQERLWMVLGVIMATFTGLGIPAWLILLARSLDTFSSLATLMAKAGDNLDVMGLLRTELNKLCIAFAVVGGICLVTGFIYVSIWTYTGEQQSLRIQKQFVRSCLNQDAEWCKSLKVLLVFSLRSNTHNTFRSSPSCFGKSQIIRQQVMCTASALSSLRPIHERCHMMEKISMK